MESNLEGDGIIDNLYHYLWAKDALFNCGTYVLLPDTVIYKYGNPMFWYFTSKNGTILRKSKSNVHSENIQNSFLKYVGNSDIVAVLYSK